MLDFVFPLPSLSNATDSPNVEVAIEGLEETFCKLTSWGSGGFIFFVLENEILDAE